MNPGTDANRQFLDPETDKNFQFLDKNLLDPETDVMEQFLDPETDIMGERTYIISIFSFEITPFFVYEVLNRYGNSLPISQIKICLLREFCRTSNIL